MLPPFDEKIKGFNLVAPPRPFNTNDFEPILATGASHVCVIPYAYCPMDSPSVIFNTKWQWWGERTEGVTKTIETAHQKKLKVIVKPQIWMRHGIYTGTLSFDTEKEWKRWETDYEKYIMHFVQVADATKADYFCIGTELKEVVKQRPEFWNLLIRKIRSNYQGQLTYAANWDEYKDVPFWNELDFVGIDAYFPICQEKTPTVKAVKEGWNVVAKELAAFSQSIYQPILFTEMGFRNIDFNCKEPWVSNKVNGSNGKAQQQAFEGFFTSDVWNAPWMAGICIWKWHFNDDKINADNTGFTPQNKPAEKVIGTYFKR